MVYLVKFILWLMSLMPSGMPYWLSARGAGLWMRFSPGKRHTTERNLERCYPEMGAAERAQLVKDSFQHYLCNVLESGQNWYWSPGRLAQRCEDLAPLDLLRDAIGRGRGVVLMAPHWGAWEMLGIFLQNIPEFAILYKPPSHEALNQALLEKRRRAGGLLIPATATGLRQLYAQIRGGKAAGVLPDQQPSAGKGEFAPFMGVPALTAVLVPRLVQRTGCEVFTGGAERLPGGRYRLHVMPVAEGVYSNDLITALTAVNQEVARCIAIDPAQYLWSYRRFKTQPEGEPPFYG
jgi:KDO2-lipid IV(A) lauroyltransferase